MEQEQEHRYEDLKQIVWVAKTPGMNAGVGACSADGRAIPHADIQVNEDKKHVMEYSSAANGKKKKGH